MKEIENNYFGTKPWFLKNCVIPILMSVIKSNFKCLLLLILTKYAFNTKKLL